MLPFILIFTTLALNINLKIGAQYETEFNQVFW